MLKHITITNLGAFAGQTDIALPAVALISGGNGKGKTSLLDIIKFFGDRGHDPDMLHGSQPEGEAVLTLDDGCQLRLRITHKDTTRWWKPADGKRWIEGRDLIDKIYRAIAYDPIRFLELSPKEQAAKLLEIAPAEVHGEAIVGAVGDAMTEANMLGVTGNGLERITTISAHIYTVRTTLNTESKQLAAYAAQLEASLKAALPDERDWNTERQRVTDALAVKQAEEFNELRALHSDFEDAKQGLLDKKAKAEGEIDADINAQVLALEKARAGRKEKATADWAAALDGLRAMGNGQSAAIKAKYKPDLNRLQSEMTQAQTYATTQAQIAGTKRAISAALSEADAKAERSKALTAALERLAALKTSLVSKFRIGGGYVEDGRIVREQDGGLVPLNRWNSADAITFCLALGIKIGGGFVCLDHFESYDKANQEKAIAACRKYAKDKGIQFILAKVGEGPLAVEGK